MVSLISVSINTIINAMDSREDDPNYLKGIQGISIRCWGLEAPVILTDYSDANAAGHVIIQITLLH